MVYGTDVTTNRIHVTSRIYELPEFFEDRCHSVPGINLYACYYDYYAKFTCTGHSDRDTLRPSTTVCK